MSLTEMFCAAIASVVGLLGILLFCVTLGAILFGATCDGTHWKLGCTTDDGVHITQTERAE